jgi:hypothetical protein
MRAFLKLLLHLLGCAFLIASALTTIWVLYGIWIFGPVIVYEPNRQLLFVEIGMAIYGLAYSGMLLIARLYYEVKFCQQ